MTRIEAANFLSNIRVLQHKESDFAKTLDMAIEALSAEPCEDVVSRRKALLGIGKMFVHCEDDSTKKEANEALADAYEFIRFMPSVQPIRPKGELIELDECSNSGYYCSNCHKKVVTEGWSNTVKMIYFCPNCGADMRGDI